MLTLEDATGELDGRLIGADGERFFQGMPPVNLRVREAFFPSPNLTFRGCRL